jgi:hypothetical protein
MSGRETRLGWLFAGGVGEHLNHFVNLFAGSPGKFSDDFMNLFAGGPGEQFLLGLNRRHVDGHLGTGGVEYISINVPYWTSRGGLAASQNFPGISLGAPAPRPLGGEYYIMLAPRTFVTHLHRTSSGATPLEPPGTVWRGFCPWNRPDLKTPLETLMEEVSSMPNLNAYLVGGLQETIVHYLYAEGPRANHGRCWTGHRWTSIQFAALLARDDRGHYRQES